MHTEIFIGGSIALAALLLVGIFFLNSFLRESYNYSMFGVRNILLFGSPAIILIIITLISMANKQFLNNSSSILGIVTLAICGISIVIGFILTILQTNWLIGSAVSIACIPIINALVVILFVVLFIFIVIALLLLLPTKGKSTDLFIETSSGVFKVIGTLKS